MDHLNDNEYAHILTIEDPIEFMHTSKRCLVNQREVHKGTPAIRNLIREAKVAHMYSAIQTGQAHRMQTLDQNLKDIDQGPE